MSIRIVTDSGSDFEQTEIKSKNIEVIPIPISFEGKDYLDGVDLSKNEFFELLEKSEDFYRWHICYFTPSVTAVVRAVEELKREFEFDEDIDDVIDSDPISMM